jgi:hypothetical protein
MCHSVADVKSTMRQGDFQLEYPKPHELAATQNAVVRAVHDFVIRLNPEPHLGTTADSVASVSRWSSFGAGRIAELRNQVTKTGAATIERLDQRLQAVSIEFIC